MDLRRCWNIDMPKIQSFLEQPESIPQIRHWMNAPGSAEPLKNACVSFPFRPFKEIIERTEHFLAAHAGILRVRVKVAPCILPDHFFKAFTGSRLDVSQGGHVAPTYFLTQTPLQFFFTRTV